MTIGDSSHPEAAFPLTPAAVVSRRTVVTTAAWAVPAVALATAMPLAAASNRPLADGVVMSATPEHMTYGRFVLTVNAIKDRSEPARFPSGSTARLELTGDYQVLTHPGLVYSHQMGINTAVYSIVAESTFQLELEIGIAARLTAQVYADADALGPPHMYETGSEIS